MLYEVIDFMEKVKKELSATEESVRDNKEVLSRIDEWLRISLKNHNNLPEEYQKGEVYE